MIGFKPGDKTLHSLSNSQSQFDTEAMSSTSFFEHHNTNIQFVYKICYNEFFIIKIYENGVQY
jgi:hypothetical protein